jgi:plastocyanin
MSVARRTATALLLGALCAACALAAPALVAGAATGHRHAPHRAARRAPHRAARRARVCRHRRRHHCPASRAKRHTAPQASSPLTSSGSAGAGAGSAAPTSAPAAAGASGSGSGAQSTATTETPPAESPSAGPARVQVIAKEYSFTLSRSEVPAGKVIVEFVNGGEDPHNLHLTEPVEGAEAGAFPTSAPGFHGDLTLNLHAGTYTLFCSLPGHEAKGMKATLTVQ